MQLIMFKHSTQLEFIQRPENIFSNVFFYFVYFYKHLNITLSIFQKGNQQIMTQSNTSYKYG